MPLYRSPLPKHRRLGSISLAHLDAELGPEQVRLGSLQSFKSLESDFVILAYVNAGDRTSSPRHIYAAL